MTGFWRALAQAARLVLEIAERQLPEHYEPTPIETMRAIMRASYKEPQ